MPLRMPTRKDHERREATLKSGEAPLLLPSQPSSFLHHHSHKPLKKRREGGGGRLMSACVTAM